MKKTVFCVLAGLTVLIGCSKLDALEGRMGDLEGKTSEIEKDMNLPTGIIMDTKAIENVNKGDMVKFTVIVNPSDFVPTKENFSLLTYHDLYTEYDMVRDPVTNLWVDGPYDDSAHCDLEIVDVAQNEEYEGAYTLAVKVGGEGNFFDDASVYALYGDKNSKDKTRYVCSNTGVDIKIIPTVEEAFRASLPHQSYYSINHDAKSYGGAKIQYFAFWMNLYRDKDAGRRVYDRKLLSVDMVGDEFNKCCMFGNDTFSDTGIVEIKLIENSSHWVSAVKSFEEGAAYATFPKGSSIVISHPGKGNLVLPLDEARIYGNSIFEIVQKFDLKQLENDPDVTFDLTEHAAFAGIDGNLKKTQNVGLSMGSFNELKNGFVISWSEGHIKSTGFTSLDSIKQKGEVCTWYTEDYEYSSIQTPDGKFNTVSELKLKRVLLSFYTKLIVKLNDQAPIE